MEIGQVANLNYQSGSYVIRRKQFYGCVHRYLYLQPFAG